MKIGWTSYILVMACVIPFAGSPAVSRYATPDPSFTTGSITPYEATSSTGSSGPPVPTCGTFLRDETYGPLTIYHTWTAGCADTYVDKPYMEQTIKKTKHIYQNGSIWECPVSPVPNAGCGAFLTSNCPSATCSN